MTQIRWGLVLTLSLSGIGFGVLTILALIQGFEHWVALLTLASVGVLTASFERLAPLRNAFIAGGFAALFAIWTQVAFMESYFKNNPDYATIEIPFGLSPEAYTFLFSPLGGLVGGLLALAIAWPTSLIVIQITDSRRFPK